MNIPTHLEGGILDTDFIKSYADREVPWGFGALSYITYKRTYARIVPGEDRTEEWYETVARCVNGAQSIGADYTKEEAERLYDYVFNFKGSFSGRFLWQAGTSLVEKLNSAGLMNCYATNIENIEDFEFVMLMLMFGGGVGISVERSKIYELPKVKNNVTITHERTNDADIIVPDSREGWVRLLHSVLKSFFYTGRSFTYSTVLLRSKGEPLETFGGVASGPVALIDGVSDICSVLSGRSGKKIRSVDALDLCNIIGRIAVAGSSRRAAEIVLSDPDDHLFLRAKNWEKGNIPAWRSHSNNSIIADSYDEIIDEVWKGYDGSGEPYGLVNRRLARTVGRIGTRQADPDVELVNPCAEATLEHHGVCNLSTLFLPNISSKQELFDISTLLYKTQKAITRMQHPDPITEKIMHTNGRIGQSICGWMQCSEEQLSWVSDAYEHLKKFDEEWSDYMGVPKSIKLTVTQPSGTLGLVGGCLPGIHPAYARHYIRRVRMGSSDPLVEYCREHGYKVQYDVLLDGKENHDICVVDFPCKASDDAILATDISAVEQLEWVVKANTLWADQAVSATVTYRQEELEDIKKWLKKNYDKKIKSVSFLPHTDHGFMLPPYEEITEEKYNKLVAKVKPLSFLSDINTELLSVDNCDSGACPVR